MELVAARVARDSLVVAGSERHTHLHGGSRVLELAADNGEAWACLQRLGHMTLRSRSHTPKRGTPLSWSGKRQRTERTGWVVTDDVLLSRRWLFDTAVRVSAFTAPFLPPQDTSAPGCNVAWRQARRAGENELETHVRHTPLAATLIKPHVAGENPTWTQQTILSAFRVAGTVCLPSHFFESLTCKLSCFSMSATTWQVTRTGW